MGRNERFYEAAARFDQIIEQSPPRSDTSREAVQARAEMRMGRLRTFLQRLGNPLDGIPVVHVGGTSGKGSTSTAIAAILTAAGYRTGLHTSPYLQVPTEKLQLDGALISTDTFVRLSEQIFAEHERWLGEGRESLTYGEAWISLMALFFRDAKVDAAVVEVGAGGRFDLTNIVQPVVSVITSVGIDHTNTLGDTIESIAWHKAGIIKPGVPAVTGVQNAEALEIIRNEAIGANVSLKELYAPSRLQNIQVREGATHWVDSETGDAYSIGLAGSFQAQNGMLAVDAVRESPLQVSNAAIHAGLRNAAIPGRAERISGAVPVLLDGAHNNDKIEALVGDLEQLSPVPEGGSRIAVVGALETKEADQMMRKLSRYVDYIICTSPQVLAKASRDAEELAEIASQVGFGSNVQAISDPEEAIAAAFARADASRGDCIVVTGSLYLVGNIRQRWFRNDDILEQQTSWPEAR